jgi:hypothetical protein
MEAVYNYWGVFENGTLISNGQLTELAQIPNVKYYVKEGPAKLTLINSDGTLNFLQIGDFQLMDISGIFKSKATVTLCEKRINHIFQLPLKISGISFVVDELVPLMNTLNEYGSAKAYLNAKSQS